MSDKKTTDAQLKAVKKYREKVKRITVDFYPSEEEIWNKVQAQDNKQRYIKDLIRADLEKGK